MKSLGSSPHFKAMCPSLPPPKTGEVGAQGRAYTPQPRVISSSLKFQMFPLILLSGNEFGILKAYLKLTFSCGLLFMVASFQVIILKKKALLAPIGALSIALIKTHQSISSWISHSLRKSGSGARTLVKQDNPTGISGLPFQLLGSSISPLPVSKS
jgi:hypothetical protein